MQVSHLQATRHSAMVVAGVDQNTTPQTALAAMVAGVMVAVRITARSILPTTDKVLKAAGVVARTQAQEEQVVAVGSLSDTKSKEENK